MSLNVLFNDANYVQLKGETLMRTNQPYDVRDTYFRDGIMEKCEDKWFIYDHCRVCKIVLESRDQTGYASVESNDEYFITIVDGFVRIYYKEQFDTGRLFDGCIAKFNNKTYLWDNDGVHTIVMMKDVFYIIRRLSDDIRVIAKYNYAGELIELISREFGFHVIKYGEELILFDIDDYESSILAYWNFENFDPNEKYTTRITENNFIDSFPFKNSLLITKSGAEWETGLFVKRNSKKEGIIPWPTIRYSGYLVYAADDYVYTVVKKGSTTKVKKYITSAVKTADKKE